MAEVLLVLAEPREATAWVGDDRSSGATWLESANGGGGSGRRWRGGCGGDLGKWIRGRCAARHDEAFGGGGAARQRREQRWRAAGGDERRLWLGCTVKPVPGWFIAEAERWTGCGNARRGRWRKRSGAGTAAAAATAGWRVAGERRRLGSRGEHRRGREELGEEGETEYESTGRLLIGSGGGDRGRA
uniref:DUF834 domain-containing protein n=2 Tax=Oryza sativa subsp. japonica TaxID=39947 RepID=Q7G264_ORYSJ|nr:hypothetical protein [Oryza sativa Japonica Group]AAP54677.1 retrotransposon protein, putative, Ty3-gypsy subclass [Oryza sativa Japonica Group]